LVDNTTAQSWDIIYSTSPSITNNVNYYVGVVVNSITFGDNVVLYYDTGGANTGGIANNNYDTPAALGTISSNTNRFEIYATYTAGEAPAAAPPSTESDIIFFE